MPPVLVIFAVLGAFLYRFDMANVSFGFLHVDFHTPYFKKFVKYFSRTSPYLYFLRSINTYKNICFSY